MVLEVDSVLSIIYMDAFRWQILNRNERRVFLPNKVVIKRYFLIQECALIYVLLRAPVCIQYELSTDTVLVRRLLTRLIINMKNTLNATVHLNFQVVCIIWH